METEGFISPLAVIGQPPEHRDHRWNFNKRFLEPIVADTAIVEALATIDSGIETHTYIGERTMVMKHAHVGHDALIGREVNIAPGAIIGGYCKVGHRVKIGIGALIRPRVSIGNDAIIGAGAVVVRNVPPGETWAGNPAKHIENKRPKLWTAEQEYDAWIEWYEESRRPRPY